MTVITHLANKQVGELRKKFGCSQETMGHIIGVSGRTVARWEANENDLSRLARQRVNELQTISEKMEGVIKKGKETEWLNTPNEALGNKSPLEVIIRSLEGVREVLNLLGRIEWGIVT